MARNKHQLMTQEEVKEKLGIADFRSIKKDQLIEFVSSIPYMDKEVAMECIRQFPEFKDFSISIVSQLYELCDQALQSDNQDVQQAIDGYKIILSNLEKQLNKRFLSNKRKDEIINQMIEVTDKIASIESNKLKFKENVLKIAGAIGAFSIGIAGALLGIKINKK